MVIWKKINLGWYEEILKYICCEPLKCMCHHLKSSRYTLISPSKEAAKGIKVFQLLYLKKYIWKNVTHQSQQGICQFYFNASISLINVIWPPLWGKKHFSQVECCAVLIAKGFFSSLNFKGLSKQSTSLNLCASLCVITGVAVCLILSCCRYQQCHSIYPTPTH